MRNTKRKNESVLILHNVRSIHNVGSIFRTAECAGLSKIYLSGYTPTPTDRFGRKRKDFAKVSLGAEESLEWEAISNIKGLIAELKKEKFQIVAVEQNENSIDYKKVKVKSKAAFVYGNEVEGIEKDILDLVDVIAEIPMLGKKESLNVSVSVGITLFRFLRV